MPIISVEKLNNANLDAETIEQVVNGEPNVLVESREGRKIPTLATFGEKHFSAGVILYGEKTQEQVNDEVGNALTGLSLANKTYATVAAANEDIANIAVNQSVWVSSATEGGLYEKKTAGATSLTKSAFDPVTQAKAYTDSALTLIDLTAFIQDTYVRADGTTATATGFASTDFIDVVGDQTYTVFTKLRSTAPLLWYDENKAIILTEFANQTTLSSVDYLSPIDARYVRINLEGVASTDKPFIKSKAYKTRVLGKWFDQYKSKAILDSANNYTNSLTDSVDHTAFTQGTYVRADGSVGSNASFASSDFIPVAQGESYEIKTKLTSGAPLVWFNKNKVLLSIDYADQTTLSTRIYTAPNGAAFVRVNLNGTATTDKPFLKTKVVKIDSLNKWFDQYQKPIVQEMINVAVPPQTTQKKDYSATDALILQGVAPYWVKRAADGSAAILDFDLDNNRYFYRGIEYSTLEAAIAAVGGLSKIVYPDTKAFVLNGNIKDGSENLAKYADASSKDFNVANITTLDTTVDKFNDALRLTRNPSTAGVYATLNFSVKANTTYVIKSANTTGLQGVRLSIKNSLGTNVLPISSWQTATEEIREFVSTIADTYTVFIELPSNGATSYLSYLKIAESVAFAGLNKDGFTLVADFTPQTQTGNECYLLVGQTATGRASYNNHFATVRIAGSHNFPTTSNMIKKDGSRAVYVPNSDTGHNIAQVGNRTTFAVSIGGGFVSLSSGYQTKVLNVDHSLVDLMNSAMIAVGCGGTNGNEKATATIHRFSVISKAYKDLSINSSLFANHSNKVLVLGDSFATKAFADALQAKLGKTVLVDGVGGSTLYQQAKRFESEPRLWDCTLVIMDGGFEWPAKYGLDFVNPIQRILTCLESVGNSRYVYVEPSPAGFTELAQGTTGRVDWNAGIERIKKIVGNDRYIPTLAQMQTFGDGSATDNDLIAQNLMPVSLTIDGQHENTKGTGHRTDIVKTWFDTHPALLP